MGMDITEDSSPSATEVGEWIAQGQYDLFSRLVVDALPQFLRTDEVPEDSDNGLPLPPGSRIVAVVTKSGAPARRTTMAEYLSSVQGGLFVPSVSAPIWTIFPTTTGLYGYTRIAIAQSETASGGDPMGDSAPGFVTYYAPPEDAGANTEIYLQEHLRPLVVRYAFYQSKLADEDDTGAQIVYADYVRAIQEVNALQTGRQVSPGPGMPDGSE